MNVRNDEVVDVDLTLKSGVVVRGKIVDANGSPLHFQIISDSGVCGSAISDPQGAFTLTGLEPDCDRVLAIFGHAEYGYNRIIHLQSQTMRLGATVNLPEIVMPPIGDRNVTIRFTFEGNADWKSLAESKATAHSTLCARTLDGKFEARVIAFTDVETLLLPLGRYVIEEYQPSDYMTANLLETAPRVLKAPLEFDVPQAGSVDVTLTIKQPSK